MVGSYRVNLIIQLFVDTSNQPTIITFAKSNSAMRVPTPFSPFRCTNDPFELFHAHAMLIDVIFSLRCPVEKKNGMIPPRVHVTPFYIVLRVALKCNLQAEGREQELAAIGHPAGWPPQGCRRAAGSLQDLAESLCWGGVTYRTAPAAKWQRQHHSDHRAVDIRAGCRAGCGSRARIPAGSASAAVGENAEVRRSAQRVLRCPSLSVFVSFSRKE